MGKKKKHKKYNQWIGEDDSYDITTIPDPDPVELLVEKLAHKLESNGIPKEMILGPGSHGLIVGVKRDISAEIFIGMPEGEEGNIAVVGGSGSGKTVSVAKPTMLSWQGPVCVTDVKGELSKFYMEHYISGVDRPYLIFDPMDPEGPSYDPFDLLTQDDEAELINDIEYIAIIIVPNIPDAKEPFWADMERGVLTAALLYYFKLGLSFSEALCEILNSSVSSLCGKINESEDGLAKCYIGEISNLKAETRANIDVGLRGKLVKLATNPYISHAFRGSREGANCFSWKDLEQYNIFIRVPEDKMELWGPAINLMYTQLIRYLQRRPEKYSDEGSKIEQTLILMDEFARFGKLDAIIPAISTLRSKKVNFCLIFQSLAQLDMIYGVNERRTILDNCQYQVILSANDADTQEVLSKRIGITDRVQKSASYNYDDYMDEKSSSESFNHVKEPLIFPHELATLKDVILLTPYGCCRVDKILPNNKKVRISDAPVEAACDAIALSEDERIQAENDDIPVYHAIATSAPEDQTKISTNFRNEGAIMLNFEERLKNADERTERALQQQRVDKRIEREKLNKVNSRRSHIVGGIVCKYFPEVTEIEPGTDEENEIRFAKIERIMKVLSDDVDLMNEIKERADRQMLNKEKNIHNV